MKLKLSYGVLHGTIHSPETGTFGAVLQAKTDATRKGTPMTLDTETSIVTVEVPIPRSKNVKKFLIPLTGFTHTVLADEENSKA